ncbi:glycosyltransferase family 4 protein [Arthrobacter globiformis]|uniref:glycosyltransferase family 4 protein n=1 Tax=Arthrobacter globiformis TaxID=1665 RepID=UPI0039784C0C
MSSDGSLLRVFGYLRQVSGQAIAIRRSPEFRDADVIHANTSRTSLYGALACVGTGKRLVIHLRDHVSIESLGRIGFWAFKYVALRRANGLIGNSKSTLETATAHIGARSMSTAVIPSPIGISVTREEEDGFASRTDAPLKVGMIARIDPWKGQSLLLKAFAKAFPDGEEQLFFFGGSLFGHEQYSIDLDSEVEDLGLVGRVHFMGHVDDISSAIKQLDVCVQASIRPEPLGQNVLQYLASGRCVIAADEGGPVEWITHEKNGLLFKARDYESLSAALSMVASDRSLMRRLQRAAPDTSGLLSDIQVAQAHGRVFRDVAVRAELHQSESSDAVTRSE